MADKRDLDVNNTRVLGPTAHGSTVSTEPVLLAGISQDSDNTIPPNRVTGESQTTRFATDRDGSLHVLPYGAQQWDYHEDSASGLSATLVQTAPGSGLSLYISSVTFAIGAATDTNFWLTTGTTTKIFGPVYIEGKSGRGVHLPFIQPKKVLANTDLRVHTSVTISHSIDVIGWTGQG